MPSTRFYEALCCLGHIPARLRHHSWFVNGEVIMLGTVWLRTAEGD
jgi:hypothetical protein